MFGNGPKRRREGGKEGGERTPSMRVSRLLGPNSGLNSWPKPMRGFGAHARWISMGGFQMPNPGPSNLAEPPSLSPPLHVPSGPVGPSSTSWHTGQVANTGRAGGALLDPHLSSGPRISGYQAIPLSPPGHEGHCSILASVPSPTGRLPFHFSGLSFSTWCCHLKIPQEGPCGLPWPPPTSALPCGDQEGSVCGRQAL